MTIKKKQKIYLHCNLFLRISGMLHKNTYQSKFLIVPEEGWFGQPKKNTSYVVSVSAFVLFICEAD